MSISTDKSVTYRRASEDDSVACHELMWESVTDLGSRQGTPIDGSAEEAWRSMEPLYRLLGGIAAEWWVAEEAGSSRLVGFARSIQRDGLLELTEFFVRPGQQSRGVGRALLQRAFPARDAVRSIIATQDVCAQARYYAAGTVAQFPLSTLTGAPQETAPIGDLEPAPLDGDFDSQRAIELAVLGHRRSDEELRWLVEQRRGHLYRVNGRLVGFSFVGSDGAGPMAALDPADLPAILLHAEGVARSLGVERLELQLPAPNAVAIRHLTGRGFRFDPWINLLMSEGSFGQFDRFIPFNPPLFL